MNGVTTNGVVTNGVITNGNASAFPVNGNPRAENHLEHGNLPNGNVAANGVMTNGVVTNRIMTNGNIQRDNRLENGILPDGNVAANGQVPSAYGEDTTGRPGPANGASERNGWDDSSDFGPLGSPGRINGADETHGDGGTFDFGPADGNHTASSPNQASSPDQASSSEQAGSPLPPLSPHSANRPVPADSPDSTESSDESNSPYWAGPSNDLRIAAAQEREEALCRALPWPTPTYAESPKCVIRPYHIRDAGNLTRFANDYLISRWMSYRFPHPYRYNDARSWILQQPRVRTPFNEIQTVRPTIHASGAIDVSWENTLNFAIASVRSGANYSQLIGGISIKPGTDVFNRSAELRFWVAEYHWNRGIATSAVSAFLKKLFFRTQGLSRVTAYTWTRMTTQGERGNPQARRVLEKNAFRREGCLRKSVYKDGVWWDQEVWGVLREDMMGNEQDMPNGNHHAPIP
ncbi:acyl-CoA N-acyltransferase [Phyllosticta citriasiana]|uniref:Acyl-CoA N-acyltransferase n=1 Tax=Phyllosticta citriasiana TaxID=595635 RepID=A0ABR1KTJ1_9PEZI